MQSGNRQNLQTYCNIPCPRQTNSKARWKNRKFEGKFIQNAQTNRLRYILTDINNIAR